MSVYRGVARFSGADMDIAILSCMAEACRARCRQRDSSELETSRLSEHFTTVGFALCLASLFNYLSSHSYSRQEYHRNACKNIKRNVGSFITFMSSIIMVIPILGRNILIYRYLYVECCKCPFR